MRAAAVLPVRGPVLLERGISRRAGGRRGSEPRLVCARGELGRCVRPRPECVRFPNPTTGLDHHPVRGAPLSDAIAPGFLNFRFSTRDMAVSEAGGVAPVTVTRCTGALCLAGTSHSSSPQRTEIRLAPGDKAAPVATPQDLLEVDFPHAPLSTVETTPACFRNSSGTPDCLWCAASRARGQAPVRSGLTAPAGSTARTTPTGGKTTLRRRCGCGLGTGAARPTPSS